MKVFVEAKIVVETKADSSYRDYDEHVICKVTFEGKSTSEVEEKIGKLQQALTHMGWKIGRD